MAMLARGTFQANSAPPGRSRNSTPGGVPTSDLCQVSSFLALIRQAQCHLICHARSNRVNLKTAVRLLCKINPVVICEGRTGLGCGFDEPVYVDALDLI